MDPVTDGDSCSSKIGLGGKVAVENINEDNLAHPSLVSGN